MDRQSSRHKDHTFIVAYAPRNTAPDADGQHFFTELQQAVHGVPARTAVWLLGDFNAHIGSDLQSQAVGTKNTDDSNDNGFQLVHLCNATNRALVNTFHAAGPTWWSPDKETSHRLDYVAVPNTGRCHL